MNNVVKTTLFLLTFLFLFNGCSKNLEDSELKAEAKKLKQIYSEKIDEKIKKNVGYAVRFAGNKVIADAIVEGDCVKAGKEMNRLVDSVHLETGGESLKLHAHTANIQSLIRHWEGEDSKQHRENLKYFRHSIKYAQEQDNVFVGFEVDRGGLLLRAVAPIKSESRIIGSIESIQGVESIVEDLKANDELLIFFMNKNRLSIATGLKQSPGVNELVVAQKEYNSELLEALNEVDLHCLYTKNYVLQSGYLMTGIEIFDISGVNSGLVVLAKKLKDIR